LGATFFDSHCISSENASHHPTAEQKMFPGLTEATLARPGTVPVPVPLLSLLSGVSVVTTMVVAVV